MLDPATVSFLEGGSALIVATVTSDGEPHASRGWGLTMLPDDEPEGSLCRCRLVLDAADELALENAAAVGSIAVTAGDVVSLKSVQLKGRVESVELTSARDDERAHRYADLFFADVTATDGTPRALLDRLLPDAFVPCIVVVDELYDQTPGPGAGAPTTGVEP